MANIGYHASHEQFAPSALLKYVQMAEKAGFTHCLSSDHFLPWSTQQGESGFAWSWLGAAMQATKLQFRVVNAPGQRYHPAIIAQAAATLAEMFPERFWLCVGSGQNLNEHITGDQWPEKKVRNERLQECAEVMRKLWTGEEVSHHGHVVVENAKLFTLPDNPPKLIGAAITPQTAGWLGSWADGLITVSQPVEKLKKVVEAFKKGGGEGKPMLLKVQLSYAGTEEKALAEAHEQWRSNIFASSVLAELRNAEQLELAAQMVTKQNIKEAVLVSADTGQHAEWLQQYIDLGFGELILHNVNLRQEKFIEDFGTYVLPQLRGK